MGHGNGNIATDLDLFILLKYESYDIKFVHLSSKAGMVMMIKRVASKNTVIFNYLSNQIIRVPPTSPEKLLLKTLFSYITIYECIEYIDRGPKQGVHNNENDAGKKAS